MKFTIREWISQKLRKAQEEVNNSIFIIHPYRLYNTWVFDDEKVGLQAEPFVAGASEYLDMIVPKGVVSCTVIFSPSYFPDSKHSIEIDYSKEIPTSPDGTFYVSREFNHSLWLCPALYKYVTEAPNKIFIKITQ